MTTPRRGPLSGLRVLEIASIAPVPFTCTVLSDLGAEVLRVDRPGAGLAAWVEVGADPGTDGPPPDPLSRGRRSVAIDLKHPMAAETVLRLVERADVFVEGFRPGVCERLGIGPEPCLSRNPRLIYGRLTGWGQTGPLAARAGHDINYLSIAGALQPIGPVDQPPTPPINYVADFGGGGMLMVAGVLAALWERERSGHGQVVDAAMVDGASLLTLFSHGMHALGAWSGRRGEYFLDGSAPFYRCYTCRDGRHVAVGALEPKFYAILVERLGLSAADLPAQYDRDGWPTLEQRFGEVFATRDRDEWAKVFEDHDACVTPVLSPWEAQAHPHPVARDSYVTVAGAPQPAPAPRFSRTPAEVASPAPRSGEHTEAALGDWGFAEDEIARLRDARAIP